MQFNVWSKGFSIWQFYMRMIVTPIDFWNYLIAGHGVILILILILISHQTCSQFAKTTGSQIICKRQVIWSISYILILKRSLNLSTATEKTTTWSDKEYRYIYMLNLQIKRPWEHPSYNTLHPTLINIKKYDAMCTILYVKCIDGYSRKQKCTSIIPLDWTYTKSIHKLWPYFV